MWLVLKVWGRLVARRLKRLDSGWNDYSESEPPEDGFYFVICEGDYPTVGTFMRGNPHHWVDFEGNEIFVESWKRFPEFSEQVKEARR
jgi:hypothetical protein